MMKYAGTHACRRRQILDYFGDEAEVVDCHCDVCDGAASGGAAGIVVDMSEQAVLLVRQLLSAVARLNGKFGVGAIADVLAGASNERSQRWQLEQLSVFGLLRTHPTKRLVAMLHRVIESGLSRQKNVGEERPMHVVEITAAGIAVMKGERPPPAGLADILPRGPDGAGCTESARKSNCLKGRDLIPPRPIALNACGKRDFTSPDKRRSRHTVFATTAR